MKKIFPHLVSVAFALFMAGVFALVVSLTYSALGRMFPDEPFTQLAGVSLFDFAALVWFGVFVYKSDSTGQYTAAAFGFLFGLAGAIGMIAIESAINAGMVTPEEMSKYLVYVFVGVSIAHMVLIYAHHAGAAEVNAKISLGIEKAKINDEGMKQAEQILMSNQTALGQTIANKLVSEVLHDLNISPSKQVIDIPALPVQEEAPQESFFGMIQNKVKNLWNSESGGRRFNANVNIAGLNTEPQSNIPNTAQANAEQPPAGKENV